MKTYVITDGYEFCGIVETNADKNQFEEAEEKASEEYEDTRTYLECIVRELKSMGISARVPSCSVYNADDNEFDELWEEVLA